MLSPYWKAVVAAIVGALMNVLLFWQTISTDGIDADERNLLITTVVGAILTVLGVFFKANAPLPEPAVPVPAPPVPNKEG
jgi:hypothetical protein